MKNQDRFSEAENKDSIERLLQSSSARGTNTDPCYQPDSSQKENINYWAGNEDKKFLKILHRKGPSNNILDNSEESDLFVTKNIWYWAKEETRKKRQAKRHK